MSPELLGVIAIFAMLALLALGTPIGVSMGVVGVIGLAILISPEAAVIKSGVVAFETISRYELGVLPLFLLMAHICISAGATRNFFDVAAKFLGHHRGGLALASIGGCAGFGAISGSSLATAATVGMVALPEMRKHNYDPALATGALAAGGTLGSMIPPSGALIVFGVIAEQSISKLFTAAIIPAATQALFYMAAIFLMCQLNPKLGPAGARAPWSERMRAVGAIWDIALLVIAVISGITFGWFTPTEAGSVGAVGALVICAVRKKLTFKVVTQALAETLRTTGMIYSIIIAAVIFSTFISVSGLADGVAGWVAGLGAGKLVAVLAMALALLVLGSFLDGMALMLLATPIFLPIVTNLGLSPIWFGIFLVRTMEIGFVHPPVGMNVYVIHGLAKDIPLTTIFRGIIPFLVTDFLHLGVLIAFPAVALWLPQVLGGDVMRLFLALACALVLAACSPRPAGGPIVLTYASSYSPTHPFSRADLEWMKHVEAASGGRLKIKPFWSGSLLSADQGMTELRHGVADIGLITPIYVRAGAQVTSGQTAFYAGVQTIEQQVEVYQCLAETFPTLRQEMAGLRVLAVQGGNLPGVITRNKPVASMADLKGLRLRVPEELVAVLKQAGADPVSMPMGEVYPAMAKGVVDGVIVSPDTLKAMHFSEVARYYSDLHAPRGAYPARAISEESFKRLPADLQKVLVDSEPVWEAAIAKSVTKAAEGGLKWGRQEKMSFIAATPEAQKQFDDFYIATTAREAHRLDPYGVNGEAMLAEAQRLIGEARAGVAHRLRGPQMTPRAELVAAYEDPHAAARAFRAAGSQVVGYIGADVPEELIAAAGMLPVRLRAETGASDAIADRYGEGGGNAIIRGFVARLLDGTYDYIDHLVVATTPSYLGALFTFLREIQKTDASFPRLSLQLCDFHHGATPATTGYNLDSLTRLKATLEGWSGRPITDAALAEAIADANASRALLGALQTLRLQGRVSGVEALQLIGTSYVTPKPWHSERLAKALRDLPAAPILPGRPVVFSGSETDTADLYRRLEAEGLRIVADDQGWGGRVTERAVADGPPLAALEARYRDMAPAPAKSTTRARVDYLLDLVRRTGAEAVVFAIRGLDHPAAWDQPEQAAALSAAGVPVIQLDPSVFNGAPLGDIQIPEAAHG